MTKKRALLTILFILFVMIIFTGCKEESFTDNNKAEITVFTTIYPIQFIVEEVGANMVEVNSIYPPGVDAHTFEPTSRDMARIAKSDAFIYFGKTMEGFVESAAEALENESVQLFSLEQYDELFDGAQTNDKVVDESSGGHHHDGKNPHIWIDPIRMITMTEIVTEKLIEIAPSHEALFNENKEHLIAQLQKLEDSFQNAMADKEKKYLIVPHAAYGYWEERYGIEQIAISGLSPSEEPSQKYLTEIITTADELGIDYLFYEQNTPDKLIEIMKNELKATTYTIHNLAVLTEEDINDGHNYFTLMEGNIRVLKEAFD